MHLRFCSFRCFYKIHELLLPQPFVSLWRWPIEFAVPAYAIPFVDDHNRGEQNHSVYPNFQTSIRLSTWIGSGHIKTTPVPVTISYFSSSLDVRSLGVALHDQIIQTAVEVDL